MLIYNLTQKVTLINILGSLVFLPVLIPHRHLFILFKLHVLHQMYNCAKMIWFKLHLNPKTKKSVVA